MSFEERIEDCLRLTVEGDYQMVSWESTKRNLIQLMEEVFKEGFLFSSEGFNGDYTSEFGTVSQDEAEKRDEVAEYAWQKYLQEKQSDT